jgi:hypothetical protein
MIDRIAALYRDDAGAQHVHVADEGGDEQRAAERFFGGLNARLYKRQKRPRGPWKVAA